MGDENESDPLYDYACDMVIQELTCSPSFLQRSVRIGYNRACRMVERMEKEGLVSAPDRGGKRRILVEE